MRGIFYASGKEGKLTRSKWGTQVKVALIQRGMTQTDLASQIGVTRQYVNDVICDNLTTPGTGVIKKISDYLGIELPDGVEE